MLGCCWCVWGHAGATSSMGSVGALEMCMEGLSELERSTGVPEFVHGSSPAPPQLLTCCSPFPGNFRGESRITNPFIHGSNLVSWKKCEHVCVNVCTICSLSCSSEWDLCLLCSSLTGTCGCAPQHSTGFSHWNTPIHGHRCISAMQVEIYSGINTLLPLSPLVIL